MPKLASRSTATAAAKPCTPSVGGADALARQSRTSPPVDLDIAPEHLRAGQPADAHPPMT